MEALVKEIPYILEAHNENMQHISNDSLIQIFSKRESSKDYKAMTNLVLENGGGHTGTITDLNWAPLAGRSFHLVASCSKDQTAIVWRLEFDYSDAQSSDPKINYSVICKLTDHRSIVIIEL
jgi:WD40 repeat protein